MKTLNFVVSVQVHNHVSVAEIQQRMTKDLKKHSLFIRCSVWRPRGTLGDRLRGLDSTGDKAV